MLYASYQPTGLWWAAPLGMAVFFIVANTIRAHLMFMAWVQGATLYALMLPWVGEYVGAYAWIALACVQSLYSALFGWGLQKFFSFQRYKPSIMAGFFISAWLCATEFLRASWPFGGFSWGRLAWGQIDGPFAGLIQFSGPAFVSFTVVFVGYVLHMTLLWTIRRYKKKVRWEWSVASGIILILILGCTGSYARPHTEAEGDSSINVAAIQGNVPRLGLDFNAQRRAVLDNHARVTHNLAEQVRSGESPQPDIVIWPENSSDINPFINADARAIIEQAVNDIQAPILVGTVTPEHNTMVVWDDNGPGDTHEKKYLQPFGEYMPYRDLLRKITPLVDKAGNFQPGQGSGVVRMSYQDTSIPLGIATCYEVAFDEAYRSAVNNGATILSTPTNNATFGFSDMTYQQLAMSRMRAIEYDRAVIVAATSGVSAIVQPDGTVLSHTRIFTSDNLQATLPLREKLTLSAKIGPWGERAIVALGTLSVLVLLIFNLTNKSRRG